MVKRIFSLPLRELQGFINSAFRLVNVPLTCPHYTCISHRVKDVEVNFKALITSCYPTDATGIKVYCEGEWKVKKHVTDTFKRGISPIDSNKHVEPSSRAHTIPGSATGLLGLRKRYLKPFHLKELPPGKKVIHVLWRLVA